MAMRMRTTAGLMAGFGWLVAASAAAGQTNEANDPTAAVPTGDIVVTAGLRAEQSGAVPFALSVTTKDELERRRIQTYRDLSYYTPGLVAEAESPGRPFIAIRGIATNSVDAASEPRVSVFEDGIANSRLQSSLAALYDVNRIEVVKGPQSTLFGRSALIGAVSIVNNRADPDARTLYLLGEGGNFGATRIEATGNVPIGTDTGTALRIAAQLRHRAGYVANLGGGDDFNGYTTAAGRVSLHAAPADAVTVDLIANYEHARDTGVSYKSGIFYPSDPATGAVRSDLRPKTGATLAIPADFSLGNRLGGNRDSFGGTLLATWQVSDGLLLSSTSGYRGFRLINRFDYDGFAFPVISGGEDTRGDQISQELRLNNDAGRFKIFGGISLFHESIYRNTLFSTNEPLFAALLTHVIDVRNPVLGPKIRYDAPAVTAAIVRGLGGSVGGVLSAAQAAQIVANFSTNHEEGYRHRDTTMSGDAFADASFQLTPRLQIEAGARLTVDRKLVRYTSVVNTRSVLAGVLGSLRLPEVQRSGLLAALSAPGAATIPQSAAYPVPAFGLAAQPTGSENVHRLDNTGPSWRFDARYTLSDQANLFLNYARGRRPAVIGVTAPAAPGGDAAFADLAAETVDSVEGGVKLRTRTLRFDASTYLYRYDNFQTVVGDKGRPLSVDAGRANAAGAEASLTWQALTQVAVFGSYAWNHARFASGLYKGNHLRLSPDHTASLGVEGNIGAVSLTPSLVYRSRAYFDDTNGVPALLAGGVLPVYNYQPSQPGYALANLQLGYAPAAGRWRIEAALQNVFDRAYVRDTGQASLAFGLPSYIAGPPRTFTLSFSIRS